MRKRRRNFDLHRRPGLDNQFPTYTGLSAADSPSLGLPPDDKVTRSNNFTIYIMWLPGIAKTDIPVPLGYIPWQIFGDAVQINGAWSSQSVRPDSTASASALVQTFVFPVWNNVVKNRVLPTCH